MFRNYLLKYNLQTKLDSSLINIVTENNRYSLRYFCQSENPNEDKNWVVVDKETGMPIFDENGIRFFDKLEAQEFVETLLMKVNHSL